MRKPTKQTVMHSYPGLVALVTVSLNKKDNIMAAGWHSYISYEPPIYGVAIGRERYTYDLLKSAGSFAINFLPFDKAKYIQQFGVYSGQHKNKLEDISFERGENSNAPILNDAYIAYECETIDVNTYGDHDWFVANILSFYRDDEMFFENGLPNLEKLDIPLYLGRSKYLKINGKTEIGSFEVEAE